MANANGNGVFARAGSQAPSRSTSRSTSLSVSSGGPWPVHYSPPGQQPNAGYRWPTQVDPNHNNPSTLQGGSAAGVVGVGRNGSGSGSGSRNSRNSGPVTILSATTGKLIQPPKAGGSSRTQPRGRGEAGAIVLAPRTDLAEQEGPPSMAAAAAVAAVKAAAVKTAGGTGGSKDWGALRTTMPAALPQHTRSGGT